MYANDPTSVHQLRQATLIEADQTRFGRRPASARPGWFRRTIVNPVLAFRKPSTPTTTSPTLLSYGSHELFAGLDKRTLSRLSDSFFFIDVEPGHSLGRQGEVAPEFVVVLDGRVGVSLDGLALAVFDAGSHFGALPLLDDGPTPYQRASFDVLERGRIAVASRLQFADILRSYPVVAQRIRAIADVRRAYLKGRADAGTAIAPALSAEFPVHMTDAL